MLKATTVPKDDYTIHEELIPFYVKGVCPDCLSENAATIQEYGFSVKWKCLNCDSHFVSHLTTYMHRCPESYIMVKES